MIVRALLLWACNAAALFVADAVFDGLHFASAWKVIVAGAVFGLVNFLVKPIVKLLALPVILLTFGIALFFVNLLMLYLTSWVSPGFDIDSFGAAVGGTIVIWIVNTILHSIFDLDDRRSRRRAARARR
jgi:putative membrane protein